MSDWTKDLFGKPVHDASFGERMTGTSMGVRPSYSNMFGTHVRPATFGERMMGESQAVHYDAFGRPIIRK